MSLVLWISWAVFWVVALAIISRMFFLANQEDRAIELRIALAECDSEKLRKIRSKIKARKNKNQARSLDPALEEALELLLEERRNQHKINY